MNTVDLLRPAPPVLDPEWSATVLESILSTPVAPVPTAAAASGRPRKARIALAGLAGLGVIGSGVAYAGGLVPGFVTDAFDGLDATSPEAFDVSGIKPIADFPLPDGTQLTVWRGTNHDGGSCEARQEDRPGDEFDSLTTACNSGPSSAVYDRVVFDRVQRPEEAGAAQNPTYFLAYGEAPVPEAATVRVVGGGSDVIFPVDPATNGFGGTLPDLAPAPDGALLELRFTFVDADGQDVATLCRRG